MGAVVVDFLREDFAIAKNMMGLSLLHSPHPPFQLSEI
jgi:hypothetical protein